MIRLIILLLLVTLLLIGCVQNTALYTWGNYSQTLYAYKKNPTEETRQNHINTLQKIIAYADDNGRRVPPGVYAELAIMKKDSANNADVTSLLNKEKAVYPESAKFIDFIKTAILGEDSNENK